jgi:hypothetical protein
MCHAVSRQNAWFSAARKRSPRELSHRRRLTDTSVIWQHCIFRRPRPSRQGRDAISSRLGMYSKKAKSQLLLHGISLCPEATVRSYSYLLICLYKLKRSVIDLPSFKRVYRQHVSLMLWHVVNSLQTLALPSTRGTGTTAGSLNRLHATPCQRLSGRGDLTDILR